MIVKCSHLFQGGMIVNEDLNNFHLPINKMLFAEFPTYVIAIQ